MTGVSKPTVLRLLLEAGAVASKYQDEAFRNLKCRRIQVDELWAFVAAKQKNVTPAIAAKNPNAGDIWLWVGIDADTKLVPSWMPGDRTIHTAYAFVNDLASGVGNRVQLTSDNYRAYLTVSTWPSARTSTTPCCTSSMALPRRNRAAIVPPNASAANERRSPASPILSTFRPASLKGRIFRS